jgi:hypothetical protein
VAGSSEYWYPTPKSIFRVENSYLPKRWKQLLPLNCWCPSTKLHPIWSRKATIRTSYLTQQNTRFEDQLCCPVLTD